MNVMETRVKAKIRRTKQAEKTKMLIKEGNKRTLNKDKRLRKKESKRINVIKLTARRITMVFKNEEVGSTDWRTND